MKKSGENNDKKINTKMLAFHLGMSGAFFSPAGISTKRLSLLSKMFMVSFGVSLTHFSWADNYFNPRFLSDDPALVADLSRFEKGLEVPPGTYRVDIYLNDGFMATRDIRFKANHDNSAVIPCLSPHFLSGMGVNTAAFPKSVQMDKEGCSPLSTINKDAFSRFDVGLQRLYISIPQALMAGRGRGYIPPEMWDDGITAGIVNYAFTGNNVTYSDQTSNYAYLNLESGVNLGAWRLRDNTIWSYSSGGNSTKENDWQHVNTYVERSLRKIKSRLVLGDGYTQSDVFDTLNFRGVHINSDESMLPDSQRGFAPVIHGIAKSTARVSIKQNGYEIYQVTVQPGPFTINDLFPSGNGGDLEVTIHEANGSAQVFTVPYSSVKTLVREDHAKYALTLARYRSGSAQKDEPEFAQGTLMYGLKEGWTAYGGTQLSDDYHALKLGLGKNLGQFGAVSLDLTQAKATLADGSKHQGQSVGFQYSKSLNDTGTNLSLAGYRYSTKGYYSFPDTTYHRMSGYSVLTSDGVMQVKPTYTDYYNLKYSKRGRMQANLTQQLGRTGSLYLTGIYQTYWGTTETDKQLQVGYSGAWDDISYTLSYSHTKSAWATGNDRALALNVSIPFSHWLPSNSNSAFRHSNVSYSMSHDLNGRMSNQVGVSGTLLKSNNLSYSVKEGYASGGSGTSGSVSNLGVSYRSAYGTVNGGYSQSDGYRQLYYGLSGGALLHANGITLSQPMNDTVVLVKAPGAADAEIENQTGVKTDFRGYAVVPYATDYHENRIGLNTNTLQNNVELDDPVISVVPTHGAVVEAEFNAHVGIKVLMTLTHKGKPVPFAAEVVSSDGKEHSIVSDNGQVWMTGLPLSGYVTAKWGEGAEAQCKAKYDLPKSSENKALNYADIVCY